MPAVLSSAFWHSAALSGVGDAILKINQAVPDYLGAKGIRQLTGIEGENNG